MTLREAARIALPSHSPDGGFDHAAVHAATSRLYVAHPSNDGVDVIDLKARRLAHTLPSLKGVAGVWVSEQRGMLFTSNRGEDTVSIFRLPAEQELYRLPTGCRPNGMAFDPRRERLLVAGVGNRETADPPTLTVIDTSRGTRLHQIEVPGRTRWATYHAATDAFYVNIADPSRIAVVDAEDPSVVGRYIDVPAVGPHGLEQDPDGRTLYCACDDGSLMAVDVVSGTSHEVAKLAGAPDVLWLNPRLHRLYVAIGDPGVVQAFPIRAPPTVETFRTGPDAHTLSVDPEREEVHVFLPETHEDLVLRDD